MASTNDIPESGAVWVALISTDAGFRTAFHELLDTPELPLELALAIDCPLSAVGDLEMQELRKARPEIVVVDLEPDPAAGLEGVAALVESGVAPAVVAASRPLHQELLLKALQSGVMEILTRPLEPDETRVALRRVLRKAGRLGKPDGPAAPGRVLALFGAKGGVGTTALATNLAVEIRRLTGERTLLLDLDIEQGETAIMLGMDPRFSLLDLLRNYETVVSGLLAACIDHHEGSGIDLLASPRQATKVESEDFELLSGDRMREVLDFLRDQYDWVVVDRPKSFHPAFNRVLEEADERYLVTTPDLQALRNITRSLPHLHRASGAKRVDPFRLVVNRLPANSPISPSEVKEAVGLEVYHTLGADFFPLNESIHEHTPAVLRESSQFSRDVQALAAKITGTKTADGQGRKGLLGGIIDAVRNR